MSVLTSTLGQEPLFTIVYTGLLACQFLGILLFPLSISKPECWGYRCVHHCTQLLRQFWSLKLTSSYLHGFIHGTIFRLQVVFPEGKYQNPCFIQHSVTSVTYWASMATIIKYIDRAPDIMSTMSQFLFMYHLTILKIISELIVVLLLESS